MPAFHFFLNYSTMRATCLFGFCNARKDNGTAWTNWNTMIWKISPVLLMHYLSHLLHLVRLNRIVFQ